jgi:hypothetical protein
MDELEPISTDVATVPTAVAVAGGKARIGPTPAETSSSVLVQRLNQQARVEATADLVMLEQVDADFEEAEPDMSQISQQQQSQQSQQLLKEKTPRGLLLLSTPSQIPDKVASAQRMKNSSQIPSLIRGASSHSGNSVDSARSATAVQEQAKNRLDVDKLVVNGAGSTQSVKSSKDRADSTPRSTAKAGDVLAEQKHKLPQVRGAFKASPSTSSQASSDAKKPRLEAVPAKAPALQPPKTTGAARHADVDFGEDEPMSSVSEAP